MPTAALPGSTLPAATPEEAHARAEDLLDVVPENPWRPLDWRWKLARALADRGGRPRRRWSDPLVLRALRYARALRRLGNPAHPKLRKLDPDLAAALALRDAPAGPLRLGVEIRLIAGQDDPTIAARTGLPAGVVAAYAATCYEARDLLPHCDALAFRILSPDAIACTGGTPEDVLRALAYKGGPAVADALLGAGPGGDEGRDDAELADLRDLLVAVQAVPLDARSTPGLLRVHVRAAELDRARAADSAAAVNGAVVFTPVAVPGGVPDAAILPAGGPLGEVAGQPLFAAGHADPPDHPEGQMPTAQEADVPGRLRTA